MNKKIKPIIITALAFLLIALIILIIFDCNDIPTKIGIGYIHFDWINTLVTLMVGLLTLYFTISIAKSQKKIEGDKIASEKFSKIIFIEQFQRIELKQTPNVKLKIKESEDNLFNQISLDEDIIITPLLNGVTPDRNNQKTLKVSHNKCKMEHTDTGMDKESLIDNPFGFCYARLNIVDKIDLDYFKEKTIYIFDLAITTKNIFGVETKCHLSPWFKVHTKGKDFISFSACHNFGYYDSVKYVGGFNE